MRSALRGIGWAAGVAAATSLCFLIHRCRRSPTKSGTVQLLPPVAGAVPARPKPNVGPLVELTRSAKIITRYPNSPRLALAAAMLPNDDASAPARFDTLDRQVSRSPGRRRRRMAWGILAISVLAIAMAGPHSGLASGRRHVAPVGSDSDSGSAAGRQQALREDQLPRVGLSLTVPEPLTSTGGGFAIQLHNSGASPALEVHIRDVIHIEDSSDKPEFPLLDNAPAVAAGTLLPGDEIGTHVAFRTSPDTIGALQQGKARVVNYILVKYEDSSHRSHKTQQCFSWSPGAQAPAPCDTANRAE